MIGRIFTVGGLTLVSRATGFFRDVMLAAVLGAGPVADAFFVALRLPNHFRAIFAEGAFNAAFVPAYARIRQQGGADPARLFADRVFTILFGVVGLLVVLALIFTPAVISLLAPGFSDDPGRFALATELTRITFPYLLLMSLVTLYGGILNALARFAAAAAAPILLNLSMMAALAVAVFFPTPGHAAAWGVLVAGVLEALLVGGDAWRNGVMAAFRWPKWDEDVKRFFSALGPATIGSAGTQIALFADTIIASFLAAGALSALYYADRLNQLPIGVIGIAVGTVLLPEMASRIATGDEAAARAAQSRAIELTLLLSVPCLVAFLHCSRPDHARTVHARKIHRRGRHRGGADARRLCARTAALRADPQRGCDVSRPWRHGDADEGLAHRGRHQRRPQALFYYFTTLAQVGLALATSIGAWLNLVLVVYFAARQGHLAFDSALRNAIGRLAAAGVVLAAALWLLQAPVARLFAGWTSWRDESTLGMLAVIGGAVYAAMTARAVWQAMAGGAAEAKTPACGAAAAARLISGDARAPAAPAMSTRWPPLRSTSSSTVRPILSPASMRMRSSAPVTGAPSSARMMSPASSAGAFGRTARLDAGDHHARCPASGRRACRSRRGSANCWAGDADIGAAHPAVPHQFAQHEARRVGGDGEADALRAHDHRGVDADRPRRARTPAGRRNCRD